MTSTGQASAGAQDPAAGGSTGAGAGAGLARATRRGVVSALGLTALGTAVGAAPAWAGGTDRRSDQGRHRGPGCIDDSLLLAPPSPAVAEQVRRLDVLDYWVGCWRGSGWVMTETGRVDYEQVERVRRTLSGEVYVVDGRGSRPGSRGRALIFSAFATLQIGAGGQPTWRANSQGGTIEVPFEIRPDGWAWELPVGGPARARYEAHFSGNRWHETGRFTPDGVTWVPSLELTVRRERH